MGLFLVTVNKILFLNENTQFIQKFNNFVKSDKVEDQEILRIRYTASYGDERMDFNRFSVNKSLDLHYENQVWLQMFQNLKDNFVPDVLRMYIFLM